VIAVADHSRGITAPHRALVAARLAMAYKLIEASQTRRRAVSAPHLAALVRAGTLFHNGKLLERPIDIAPTEPSESTET
jgi:putative transposase